MIPEDNRFESDPADALPDDPGLPAGWSADSPDGDDPATVARLTQLLRGHERAGRGWAGSGEDEVRVEVSERGLAMRENLVVRDPDGRIQEVVAYGAGWGHGIGMCQVGAMGRARAGQDYRTILNTYYPGTTVTDLY